MCLCESKNKQIGKIKIKDSKTINLNLNLNQWKNILIFGANDCDCNNNWTKMTKFLATYNINAHKFQCLFACFFWWGDIVNTKRNGYYWFKFVVQENGYTTVQSKLVCMCVCFMIMITWWTNNEYDRDRRLNIISFHDKRILIDGMINLEINSSVWKSSCHINSMVTIWLFYFYTVQRHTIL